MKAASPTSCKSLLCYDSVGLRQAPFVLCCNGAHPGSATRSYERTAAIKAPTARGLSPTSKLALATRENHFFLSSPRAFRRHRSTPMAQEASVRQRCSARENGLLVKLHSPCCRLSLFPEACRRRDAFRKPIPCNHSHHIVRIQSRLVKALTLVANLTEPTQHRQLCQ